MRFLNTILDVIFPVKCLACGLPGSELCPACLKDAPVSGRESPKWIFPIYDYRHPSIKKALWMLKYKGKKRLAGILAEPMHDRILEEVSEFVALHSFRAPLLVPIPISGRRYRERGYNQTELICRELIKLNRLRHGGDGELDFENGNNILIRQKDTEHQARIENKLKRLENIKGSFSVKNSDAVRGKNIILIDDILTTGATLGEARKVLKLSGARKIIAFTVAH